MNTPRNTFSIDIVTSEPKKNICDVNSYLIKMIKSDLVRSIAPDELIGPMSTLNIRHKSLHIHHKLTSNTPSNTPLVSGIAGNVLVTNSEMSAEEAQSLSQELSVLSDFNSSGMGVYHVNNGRFELKQLDHGLLLNVVPEKTVEEAILQRTYADATYDKGQDAILSIPKKGLFYSYNSKLYMLRSYDLRMLYVGKKKDFFAKKHKEVSNRLDSMLFESLRCYTLMQITLKEFNSKVDKVLLTLGVVNPDFILSYKESLKGKCNKIRKGTFKLRNTKYLLGLEEQTQKNTQECFQDIVENLQNSLRQFEEGSVDKAYVVKAMYNVIRNKSIVDPLFIKNCHDAVVNQMNEFLILRKRVFEAKLKTIEKGLLLKGFYGSGLKDILNMFIKNAIFKSKDMQINYIADISYQSYTNGIVVKCNSIFDCNLESTTLRILVDNQPVYLEVSPKNHHIYIGTKQGFFEDTEQQYIDQLDMHLHISYKEYATDMISDKIITQKIEKAFEYFKINDQHFKDKYMNRLPFNRSKVYTSILEAFDLDLLLNIWNNKAMIQRESEFLDCTIDLMLSHRLQYDVGVKGVLMNILEKKSPEWYDDQNFFSKLQRALGTKHLENMRNQYIMSNKPEMKVKRIQWN